MRQEITARVTSTKHSHKGPIILLQVSELTPQGAHLLEAVLRAGEPGTEPRVNHCLPPPTQVTLVFHIDTVICNTASLHDAKSHLPPHAIWGRICLQP